MIFVARIFLNMMPKLLLSPLTAFPFKCYNQNLLVFSAHSPSKVHDVSGLRVRRSAHWREGGKIARLLDAKGAG